MTFETKVKLIFIGIAVWGIMVVMGYAYIFSKLVIAGIS
jgi:hypothetical protein